VKRASEGECAHAAKGGWGMKCADTRLRCTLKCPVEVNFEKYGYTGESGVWKNGANQGVYSGHLVHRERARGQMKIRYGWAFVMGGGFLPGN